MKKYSYLFLIMLFLCSCQDELREEFGYLQLSSVELNKTVIPSVRSEEVSEKLALDLLRDGRVIKHVDDWTVVKNESFLLPTGEYVVKVYSADKELSAVGFTGSPYYSGQSNVFVEKNVAKPVTVVCKMAQTMVSVHYSDNFKKSFKAYSCAISNQYGTVDFVQNETRAAYFPADDLTALLSLTNTDNKSFTLSQKVTDIKAQYHYKFNYDVTNEGSGEFNITVDQTTNNYIVNITVPLTSDADPSLHVDDADAWGQFAYLYGRSELTDATEPLMFQYKKTDDVEWLPVASTLQQDGAYTAKTEKLDFATTYQYRLVCGAKVSSMTTFTTETYQMVPNLNFDTWTFVPDQGTFKSNANWFANPVADDYDNAQAYWASGNTGVTSFLAGRKPPITVRVEGDDAHRGYAAKMTTITGVTLVKSAAGNLFIGKYKTDMGNPSASVSFGRPYIGARPVQLKGFYKYLPKPTNEGSKPTAAELPMDECNIYIRLWDAGGNEIGFGEFVGKDEVTTYMQFTINVTYTVAKVKPAKMTIVATSSRYGGDFGGGKSVVGRVGNGSTLWIDEFELVYY